jgi:arylsulfatase
LRFLGDAAKHPDHPFFIDINWRKNHQPNLPAPEFEQMSLSKTKHADAVVGLDILFAHIMDKVRELGLDTSTLVFYTVDSGAWLDVYPTLGPQLSYRADHLSRSRETRAAAPSVFAEDIATHAAGRRCE